MSTDPAKPDYDKNSLLIDAIVSINRVIDAYPGIGGTNFPPQSSLSEIFVIHSICQGGRVIMAALDPFNLAMPAYLTLQLDPATFSHLTFLLPISLQN